MTKTRCEWATSDPIYLSYHDNEWGVPVHDDRRLFEMINLEGAQAGLSWLTILKRREGYRKAFDDFDAKKIVKYTDSKRLKLLGDKDIVRNRLKINAVIENARAYLQVSAEFGSFDSYIWGFVSDKPISGNRTNNKKAVAASEAMSKDLRKRGFKFVGATICYAFMQAVGMVNDHSVDCFLYKG